jgi:hypothetical protein
MSIVDEVYKLVAKRNLAVKFKIYELASQALVKAAGTELLALHEAIVDSLEVLLLELGEHGLQNQALLGIDVAQIDVRKWAQLCAQSWDEVKRLRSIGLTSRPLIDPYVGGWMDPIGSVDWLERMKRGVARHLDATWINRVAASLDRPP